MPLSTTTPGLVEAPQAVGDERQRSFDSVKELNAAIRRLHRRLQRPLPTLRLDQDRRRLTAPRDP
jgi:hypothetical protein